MIKTWFDAAVHVDKHVMYTRVARLRPVPGCLIRIEVQLQDSNDRRFDVGGHGSLIIGKSSHVLDKDRNDHKPTQERQEKCG